MLLNKNKVGNFVKFEFYLLIEWKDLSLCTMYSLSLYICTFALN